MKLYVRKKTGALENWDPVKIGRAVSKSADRIAASLSDEEIESIVAHVEARLPEHVLEEDDCDIIRVEVVHSLVEGALEELKPDVARSYKDYRNWVKRNAKMMADVTAECNTIQFLGDKSNANADSQMVSTKRIKKLDALETAQYQEYFLNANERAAAAEGYIYVHDKGARLDTMNCFDRSTRFITDKGVKSFYDFCDGDEVRVLSHKGIWRKAVVRQYGWQKLQKVTFTKGSSKKKTVLVTANHRWILKDGTETTDLKIGDRLCATPVVCDFNWSELTRGTWRVQNIEPYILNPKSKVWCLEVEVDHSFLLENGIPTGNCCIFNMEAVLSGGFEMGNVWYNEPKTLDTAFDVIGDVVLMAASQQYGGFTTPRIDDLLEPYAEKSYQKYLQEYVDIIENEGGVVNKQKADKYATKKVLRDIDQGFQGWEYKFNTVASSRGDYPFLSVTFGLNTSKWGKALCKSILKTRMNGQGKEGFKKPVLFPKLIFLYDEKLHGPGGILEDVFDAGIECSSKTMYPDYLNLTGQGYVPSMYKQYGKVVSPMGCVDGNEVITYKWKGTLYVESFRRMWNRLSAEFSPKSQRFKDDPCLYLDPEDVEIYDTKEGFVKVNRVVRNVSTDWRRVTFSNGRQLLCTADHPFEIINKGVVYAANLTEGEDHLLINSKQYSENIKWDVDKDYAWMMGMLLCDGTYGDSIVRISVGNDEKDLADRFSQTAAKFFSYNTKETPQQRGQKGCYLDVAFHASSSNAEENLVNLGNKFIAFFGGKLKVERQIPNEVFSWNQEAKLAFLAGMIDADGSVNKTSHGGSVIQIGSTNKELALQQMALAQALGYPARMYPNHYKKNSKKMRYRVEFFPDELITEALVSKKKRESFRASVNTHVKTESVVTRVEIVNFDTPQYSYDVSTDSEHFEVSGVYSHNCRAFLSPWYERGGMYLADENDVPVFEGRFNIGVVSLHLPMILAKARRESKDFYEVLDYYLEMIRKIHLRTYAHLSHMKASMNTLGFCEGGFYGGHLEPDDKIEPCLESATASFGITALNELQVLYNGKTITEDGQFALEVMEYINKKVDEFKKTDKRLYAIYGTPAESLAERQVTQFRKEFGIVDGVSNRPYVSNSFHCHVSEEISPIQKQNLEKRFWNLFNGGKIQYVRYHLDYNTDAIKSMVRRAMDMGFYEGVNLSLAYCDDCGHQELEMDVCPKCGSRNLTKIDRINGYLGFSRVHGDTRLNNGKMAEIAERVSM